MRLHLEVVETIKKRDPEKAAQVILSLMNGFPDRVSDIIRGGIGAGLENNLGMNSYERERGRWDTQSVESA
jgi:hypothetical protein